MRITDQNNPLECCKIRIYEYSEEWFDGIVSYNPNSQEVNTWIMYENISNQSLHNLCEFISKRLFTVHIKTRQENILTCFLSSVITPIDTSPMDSSGLIMISSSNWIENYHIEGINELFINEAELIFPYAEYWFKRTLKDCKEKSIIIKDNITLKFRIDEKTRNNRFELKTKSWNEATLRIIPENPLSIKQLFDLQEELLLLFRYCSNLWLPQAKIYILDNIENTFAQYIEELPKERTISTTFHYIGRFKGANQCPEPNKLIGINLSLGELIKKPYSIDFWLNSFHNKIYPMRLIGDCLYSTHIELSERLMKQIVAFESLAKLVYTKKENKKLKKMLMRTMSEFDIKPDDIFPNCEIEDIAEIIFSYRNCIAHGDNYEDNECMHKMEIIMHRILISFLKKHILQLV